MQREREQIPTIDAIPSCGFRARRWARFERDLEQWLETPAGRFAHWRAAQAVTADQRPAR